MRKQILSLLLLDGLLLLVTMSCSLSPLVPWLAPTPTPTPKERGFKIGELLIDTSVLPSHCSLDGPSMELPYEEKPSDVEEDLYILFGCYDDPRARGAHTVYRFPDSQAAAKRFRNFPWLSNADRVTSYQVPDWMQCQSSVADQFRFACADFYGGYPKVHSRHCAAIGQYDEYISVFSIGISPPESMPDYSMLLEQILQAIDERMALYLTD